MSAVQGGFIVLSLGSHCGKPQSQSACSPQLEEEEDHGKIPTTELMLYMQRHGKAFESYSLYAAAAALQDDWL